MEFRIQAAATTQGGSLPGIFLRDEMDFLFYIIFNHKYWMLIGLEVIWYMDYATGPVPSLDIMHKNKTTKLVACIEM